jgi:hypothetical protein
VSKPDYTDAIKRAQEKLRKKSLPKRTSTYVEGSIRQTQGSYAEIEGQRWLQDELLWAGRDWTVLMWQEARKELFGGCGPFDSGGAWEAIKNSQNGDLYVYTAGDGPKTLWAQPAPVLLFSVEVKSSEKWPNVSITWSELTDSSARYLWATTKQGTWICTMDDARKNAFEVEKVQGGAYWVVPHDRITKLTIKEIIDAEERKARPEFEVPPTGGTDIPF